MKNNPERKAWIILLSAFGAFCTLCAVVPSSLYWYAINATTPYLSEVTSVRGTVLLTDGTADLTSPLLDGNTITIQENFTITTDDTSQAILTFPDDSSLTMYSDTSITLREIREPRFSFSYRPALINIEVQKGRVRATASRSRTDLNFNLLTPQAQIALQQGSFSIEVDDQETQVTTRLGQADMTSGDETINLSQGQRAVAQVGTKPTGPLPAAKNILSNSEFSLTFTDTWRIYVEEPIEGVTTTVNVQPFEDRKVLVLKSEGRDNVHTETGVIQEVNKDIRDFQSVRLFAEVRLIEQSLPGGGQLGSEFPIMVHVAYKDADNNDRDWFHGFYYKPPPENYILYNQPDNSNEALARFIWYPYESVNLLTTLGPAKPVFIKSIRIYASGWIYESMVANISLLAEE